MFYEHLIWNILTSQEGYSSKFRLLMAIFTKLLSNW